MVFSFGVLGLVRLQASAVKMSTDARQRAEATFLADQLLLHYPQLLSARYGFSTDGIDGVSVVEGVARRRSFLLKGGGLDLEKAAHTLLQDYRSGALGRISLETPESRAALLASYRPEPSLGETPEMESEVDDDER